MKPSQELQEWKRLCLGEARENVFIKLEVSNLKRLLGLAYRELKLVYAEEMKELIPELENQSALLIKKYVIDPDRSLEYLSKDEIGLVEFLRKNLKK